MKHIPILFNTAMVEAILAGQKSVTRRAIKGIPIPEMIYHYSPEREEASGRFTFVDEHTMPLVSQEQIHTTSCPYGMPGDILWVRETWKSVGFDLTDHSMNIMYRDGFAHWVKMPPEVTLYAQNSWKPSIHMPKAAARIYLRVKRVEVDRIQNISEVDAISEGILVVRDGPSGRRFKNYFSKPSSFFLGKERYFWNPITSFFSLWCSINGSDSLESNPWVWIVEFEVCSKNEKEGASYG